jgi:hypothetical protein
VSESSSTNGSNRVAKKVRTLAIGALATASLAIPAVSALGLVTHDAFKVPEKQKPVTVTPSSHRLALTLHANSVRLT